jgi:hypothetical protein
MRAVFGVVGLLIVLAIVALVAKKQLQASSQAVGAVVPAASGADVATQSRQLQQQVGNDMKRALEQGAASRGEAAGQ